MNNVHYTRNQESVDKHKKILYKIIFKAQSDIFYLWALKFTIWIHVLKKVCSSLSKNKHLFMQSYVSCLINYNDEFNKNFKVFKHEKNRSTDFLTIIRDADIDENTDWKLYNNSDLSMSNFNFIFRIHKTVVSISIIFTVISTFSVQKVQKQSEI